MVVERTCRSNGFHLYAPTRALCVNLVLAVSTEFLCHGKLIQWKLYKHYVQKFGGALLNLMALYEREI